MPRWRTFQCAKHLRGQFGHSLNSFYLFCANHFLMDNQKILRFVLCLAIIAAFFLPLSNVPIYGTELSALSFIKNGIGNIGGLSSMQLVTFMCLLVIFVCVTINLMLAILRRSTSVFFNLLPLLAVIGIIAFTITHSKENVAEALQSFGTGFYIMFIGSFLLPFTSVAVTPTNA